MKSDTEIGENMENKWLYGISAILSVLLMIPEFIRDCDIVTMLSNIGCSGIAASIMAIYIEINNSKREKKKLEQARKLYLSKINDQLSMFLGRILWFDARMSDDDFDWSLQPTAYLTFDFMKSASEKYPTKETISFEEAKKRLESIGEKYDFIRQAEMIQEKRIKVQKMFAIIAESSVYLLNAAKEIKDNKLELGVNEYLSLKEIDSLVTNINNGISFISQSGKNYSTSVKMLLQAAEIIRKAGNFTDEISLKLQGNILPSEL